MTLCRILLYSLGASLPSSFCFFLFLETGCSHQILGVLLYSLEEYLLPALYLEIAGACFKDLFTFSKSLGYYTFL